MSRGALARPATFGGGSKSRSESADDRRRNTASTGSACSQLTRNELRKHRGNEGFGCLRFSFGNPHPLPKPRRMRHPSERERLAY